MDDSCTYRYVFGPVPSRRLGRSLGVDLVPFKTCTFDCVYCQLGRTSKTTSERAEYVPAAELIENVKRKLDAGPRPDYVTLSGSGEPTLHTGIGDIIAGIHAATDVPVTVLTNGSLFYLAEVRAACVSADLVAPSLDAPNASLFQQINRPHPDITFDRMVDGLVSFRNEYTGPIWLEVFFIGGVNTGPAAMQEFERLFDKIRPDKIQLNTAVRPTAERGIEPVAQTELQRIADQFGDRAEVIADFSGIDTHGEFGIHRADITSMLRRRPCTATDIADGLRLHPNEVMKYIRHLESAGTIVSEDRAGTVYYLAAGTNEK